MAGRAMSEAGSGSKVEQGELIARLQTRAARLREHSLVATSEAGSGHPSSCLSAADLVAALFFEVMRYDPHDPGNPLSDRFVLSKGHGAPLLYAAWAEAGAFPVEHLRTLRRFDSDLEGHPTPNFAGTVAATGSLGQGLSIGLGLAWNARQIDHTDQRIYVLLGDGEMAEGSVWEAIALAAHNRLGNLTAIVDVNALGQSQRTMYGFDVDAYAERFRSFGWEAVAIDGHDMVAVVAALRQAVLERDRPFAIRRAHQEGAGRVAAGRSGQLARQGLEERFRARGGPRRGTTGQGPERPASGRRARTAAQCDVPPARRRTDGAARVRNR